VTQHTENVSILLSYSKKEKTMITFLLPGKVTLTSWNIAEIVSTNKYHFVGYSCGDGLGRASTPIADFDENRGIGRTESGSEYELIGKPGLVHSDALYVLEQTWALDQAYKWVYPINLSITL
tara:strand:- start:1868 stop:2233 length:366 start_codon:yes stop_codon:yes gene_type:complete